MFFPVHPRTQKRLHDFGIGCDDCALRLLPPLPYPEFIALLRDAAIVVTDSGGIQEEATVLGIPCLTLRQNTERPITLKTGLNELVRIDSNAIGRAACRVLEGDTPKGCRPPLWDGKTAERIVDVLLEKAATRKSSRESCDARELAMLVRRHT